MSVAFFTAIYGKIFEEMTQKLLEVVKADGKNQFATNNDIRSIIERIMIESCVVLNIGAKTHVIHEPEKYNVCTFKISRGDREGCECGSRITKSGTTGKGSLCAVHVKALQKANNSRKCSYVPEKGIRGGHVCGASIKTDDHFCSKHRAAKIKPIIIEEFKSAEFVKSDDEADGE